VPAEVPSQSQASEGLDHVLAPDGQFWQRRTWSGTPRVPRPHHPYRPAESPARRACTGRPWGNQAMRTSKAKIALAVTLACLAVGGWLLLGQAGFYLFLLRTAHTLPFRGDEFGRIVSDIESGRLASGADGIVQLPSASRGLTTDGCVYVTRLTDGTRLELFVVWRGKASNLKGYLHCGRQLAPPDLLTPAQGNEPAWIVVVGPRVPFQGSKALAEPIEVSLDRPTAPSWYQVSRSLD
jgi:hypothetical protein